MLAWSADTFTSAFAPEHFANRITNLEVGVSVRMTLNSFGFSLLLRQRIKDQEINLELNGRARRLGDRDAPPSGVGDSTLAVFPALYTHLLRESKAF